MNQPAPRPRSQPVIAFDLVRTDASGQATRVGSATFRSGKPSVEAPDDISVAVGELLGRAFVDRVQADERPRGYRRTRQGQVDMLVPGMAEHFVARLRGLWLPYPDGSVVTARETEAAPRAAGRSVPEVAEAEPPITDPALRVATLAVATTVINARALAAANEPATGLRPSRSIAARTDCGWIV